MKKLLIILFIALIGYTSWVNADDRTPEQIVEQTSTEILKIINENNEKIRNDPTYVDKVIDEKILPYIDVQAMGKLILGKYWRTATDEQRQEFVHEFQEMLIRTYSKSIADYGSAKVKVLPVQGEQSDNLHRVRTELDLGSGSPLQVDYIFRKVNGQWKAFDLIVGGLSMVKNFRTSFTQEISETSLDALITRLKNTNASPDSASS
ncbi:MAG: ABC transporter substrate-binding protein [Pseudomonadota bacterium]